jgi:hypothetical protein
MKEVNETMETMEVVDKIEESKEALVEAANDESSNVGKVVIGVGLAGLTIAGVGYGIYKYVQKKRSAAMFEEEFADEDDLQEVEDDVEDFEEVDETTKK